MKAGQDLVWVTRAEPGATRTAGHLHDLGLAPLVAPLIETRPLPGPAPEVAGLGALAFTSRAGVAAFVARMGALPRFPVFTVGDATAEAARTAGFMDVRSASGSGPELLAMILGEAPLGSVLHAGAREPAFDLVGGLIAAGREARSLALYETIPAPDLPPAALRALQRGEIASVLIHSPAAARVLAGFVGAEPVPGAALNALALIALSPDCAAPLKAAAFAARITAARPDESSLLEALLGAGAARS